MGNASQPGQVGACRAVVRTRACMRCMQKVWARAQRHAHAQSACRLPKLRACAACKKTIFPGPLGAAACCMWQQAPGRRLRRAHGLWCAACMLTCAARCGVKVRAGAFWSAKHRACLFIGMPLPESCAACGCAVAPRRFRAATPARGCRCAGADPRARGRSGWPCRAA